MHTTIQDLRATAALIDRDGLHTGDQFAAPTGALDVCAAAYVAARGSIPTEFYDDEIASITLIEANPRAMAAIQAISRSITNYAVPDTSGQPDVIEHVSNWANTAPIGENTPPSTAEVIGRILRAADQLQQQPATAA